MLAQGVASRCSRVDAPRSACAAAHPPRSKREAIIGGAICRFCNYSCQGTRFRSMTRSALSQLFSARHVDFGRPSASCDAAASGRWDDACPSAVIAAVFGDRGRVAHGFVRDRRSILVIAYEVMPKGSAVDHQPRGARETNGADSDRGPIIG
jgi:hypothetical protein